MNTDFGKRKADEGALAVVKKSKHDNQLITSSGKTSKDLIQSIKRTSNLKAPIMQLIGHQGDVYTCKFDPSGQHLASGSFDKEIFLWNTYDECRNYGVLKGHKGAILELQWSFDGLVLASASTDKTIGIWDSNTGIRVKRCKGHHSFVNSCDFQRKFTDSTIIASVSDDSTLKLWDSRYKNCIQTFDHKFPLTSVSFSKNGDLVFIGGVDNHILAYDVRRHSTSFILKGHSDTITGLRLSPDGNSLLSNSMDNTVRIWDVRPFAPSNRCVASFEGAPHGIEKNLIRPAWSPDCTQIAAGSSDRSTVVWDVATRKILYKLPGHKGCVNEVDFHPYEPILLSASTDRTLFLGEIDPTV